MIEIKANDLYAKIGVQAIRIDALEALVAQLREEIAKLTDQEVPL